MLKIVPDIMYEEIYQLTFGAKFILLHLISMNITGPS